MQFAVTGFVLQSFGFSSFFSYPILENERITLLALGKLRFKFNAHSNSQETQKSLDFFFLFSFLMNYWLPESDLGGDPF